MGVEPVENRVVRLGKSVDDGNVAMVADVLDVLNPRWKGGVVRKFQDKCFDTTRVSGEEMIEEGWVLRSDDEGEGQVGVGEN